ncbi:MAG: hypothetical protein U1E60_07415 [Reyranellaceae bacterium]
MTTLNVAFSPTLVGPLTSGTPLYIQPGVWVDAVYFTTSGGTTTANWSQLVANGVLQSGNLSITLPTAYNGGKVYLLVWSGASTTADPFQTGAFGQNPFITQESDISIANAESDNYRFDSVELTLSGNVPASINDVANLTSVVGFGLPMQLSNGTNSVGYNVSGSTIFSDIQAINSTSDSLVFPFVGGPLGTGDVDRYGTAPASASQLTVPPFPSGTAPPFTSNDWVAYVSQLQSPTTLNQPTLKLAGFFNGAPDANGIWHNQGFYDYSLSYDGTNFWLSPAANSQVKGYIQISPSQLEGSIYSTAANVLVYTNKTDATPYTIFNPSTPTPSDTMNVGANNQWGDVLKELFTGFTAGFWQAQGTSLNANVSATVDLNKNWNWDPTYAFGTNQDTPQTYYDHYSQIFFANTNSYGSGYSDNLMALYRTGGPLLSLSNGAGGDVDTLSLTLYADGDTPGGYTTPTIYNYLAPSPSGTNYVAPLSSSAGSGANSLSMGLNFSAPAGTVGQTTWLLDQTKAKVTLNVLTGITGNTPSWTPITLQASAGQSLWWNWQISSNGSGYTATPIAGGVQDPGSLVISGMPINTSQGGGITWYQIVVSALDGSASKAFNLYTTLEQDNNLQPGMPVITGSQSTIEAGVLTVGGTISYPQGGTPLFAPGMYLSGAGITTPVKIISNGTGSGGAGTYNVSDTSLSITTEAISGTSAPVPVSKNGYGFTPSATAQQIDGGANVAFSLAAAPFISDPTIAVNFQNGVFTSIDPSLMVMGPQPTGSSIPMLGTPSAPIAGTLSGGVFTALANTTYTSTISISATTSSSSVSIGWVGLAPVTYPAANPSPPPIWSGGILGAPVNPNYDDNGVYLSPGWTSGYTNKLSALDYGVVLATNTATGVVVNGAVTQADIDGQWQTPAIPLAPGTYTVTVQEFPGANGFQNFNPVGNVSSQLNLTIQAAAVGIAPGGTHVDAVATGTLDPHAKSGAWIDVELATVAAMLQQGAALLLYATAADGSLIGRDGQSGSGVALADAVLAKIGLAQSDSGHDLLITRQSVFLPVTEQMHFAMLNKDGSINATPSVAIGGAAGGTLDIDVGGVHLSAKVGNDLPDLANLANLQRAKDLPLLFLAHGSLVDVEVAGSAANTNTVGFVHFDVDASGHFSVGSVAYGASGFSNAVLANMDPGFSLIDGGRTFDRTASWVVAGPSGFYAPVMKTQSGEVFVVGTANSDGREHIRLLGENVFGIEDLAAGQRSDFDYNDMLIGVHLEPSLAQ